MFKEITIVVKGQLEQASKEAVARNVYCNRGNQVNPRECVLWSDDRYLTEIAAWFADTPELIPGYGYPDGTCLIYSVHDPVTVTKDVVQDANWRADDGQRSRQA